MLLDQLQMMVGPDARAAFHRQMQNRKRDYGQEFWWAPGGNSTAVLAEHWGDDRPVAPRHITKAPVHTWGLCLGQKGIRRP